MLSYKKKNVTAELNSDATEELKLTSKGRVLDTTSKKCEEIVQTLEYFEEMEREQHVVSPANLGALKTALESVQRCNLASNIKVQDKGLKTIASSEKDDLQVEEIEDNSPARAAIKLVPSEEAESCHIEQNSQQTSPRTPLRTVGTKAKASSPLPSTENSKQPNLELAPNNDVSTANGNKSEIKEKEHVRENAPLDNNILEETKTKPTEVDIKMAGETKGTSGFPTTTLPCSSSLHELPDDDVVTDGIEKMKINLADSRKNDADSKEISPHESGGHTFQTDPPLSNSNGAKWPTGDLSSHSDYYYKAGYSVLISSGKLCQSTTEKGMVEMENGTTFSIAVKNNRDYAVEVDVTFNGRFLGFWTMDALQSYPLIIEGSAWEKSKLTFSSDSPEAEDGMLAPTGKIELEFKPEALMLFVKHVRLEKTHEVLMTDFKLATVGDLKEEIYRTLWEQLGEITCLIKDGEVLNEQKFMRHPIPEIVGIHNSYSLKDGDVIQVLTSEEPILIESHDMEPFTVRVDPRYDSPESLIETISKEMNVPSWKLRLQLDGKDIAKITSLAKVFLKSPKPVVKAVINVDINIIVDLPNEEAKKVRISWFATVDDLKRYLLIPRFGTLLKINDTEIYDNAGFKQLVDVGIKEGSEITVTSSTGATSRSLKDPSTSPKSKGSIESPSPASDLSNPSSEFDATPYNIPEEIYGSLDHFKNMEQMLEDESFCGCYQLDTQTRRFAKDKQKSVTLVVQLCPKSGGAFHQEQTPPKVLISTSCATWLPA